MTLMLRRLNGSDHYSSGANNAKELPSNSAQCQVQTITNKIDANKSLKLSINLTQCSWVSSGLHWP